MYYTVRFFYLYRMFLKKLFSCYFIYCQISFLLYYVVICVFFFFFQAEDGIRDIGVTGVQTCALPIYALPHNWRSDKRILAVANVLAEPLLANHPQVPPLTPGNDADGEVDTIVHESYAAELSWLADEVASVHDGGTPWHEIGVLVRDNKHAAGAFDALTARGVPV